MKHQSEIISVLYNYREKRKFEVMGYNCSEFLGDKKEKEITLDEIKHIIKNEISQENKYLYTTFLSLYHPMMLHGAIE